MWRHTQMVVLVALSAAIYAAVLIPLKGIPLVPGFIEIRPANAFPVVFGLLTALGFGSFLVALDGASEGSVPWALLVARLTTVTVFAAVFVVRRPRVAARRSDLPVLALIGLLVVGADSMYAVASTKGLLSVVAVLSSLYPVVTIGLARCYLRERLRLHQQVGVAAALGGAVAISAA